MKNVTISLDDKTHRRARIRAAEMGTSLSALVKSLIENLDEDSGQGEEIMPSGVTRSKFDRLAATELKLRKTLTELRKQVPAGFRASDRLTRDEIHDRARDRKEWREQQS